MKRRLGFALLVIGLALAASVRADDASANAERFEAFKRLAGDWVQVGADGKPADKVVSSIRVTSGGTVVEETLFPGSGHEMVTMYHMDGSDLILTHYCAQGNQPRLRAEPGADVNRISFKFVGGTNMKSEKDLHMDHVNFIFVGKGRFKAEWAACKNGATCHQVTLDLVRKAK